MNNRFCAKGKALGVDYSSSDAGENRFEVAVELDSPDG